MSRERAQALLIDLDGVLRRWDPAPMIAVEVAHGLKPAALLETAMSWDIYRPAMAGEITDAEWMELVASRLPLEIDVARAAVAEWQSYRGEPDPEVLAFIREVRAGGRRVGLATNATDRLRGDLETLGLLDEVDVVISSWEQKVHKPAPEFFTRACQLIRVLPKFTLFVDDDNRAVLAARAAGLSAYRWSGPQHLDYLRKALDLAE